MKENRECKRFVLAGNRRKGVYIYVSYKYTHINKFFQKKKVDLEVPT